METAGCVLPSPSNPPSSDAPPIRVDKVLENLGRASGSFEAEGGIETLLCDSHFWEGYPPLHNSGPWAEQEPPQNEDRLEVRKWSGLTVPCPVANSHSYTLTLNITSSIWAVARGASTKL